MNKFTMILAGSITFGILTMTNAHAQSIPAKNGDGLYRIAQRAGYSDYSSPTRWNAIAKLNGYTSYRQMHLKPGQLVKVSTDKPIELRQVSKAPLMMAYISNQAKGCNYYQDLINQAGAKYNVRPSLLRSQLSAESGCNPSAANIGAKEKSIGIAQINLKAHTDVSFAQATNPVFAIFWQAQKMRTLIDMMGSEYNALRAYNCGTGGAKNPSCGAAYANKILNNS